MALYKINFHMHSTGSDGRLKPEEVIKEAITAGLDYICFTDHYRLPDAFNENIGFFSENYIKDIKILQEKYKNKIDISFGTEVDWLENYENWTKKELKKHKFDYVIGSVHTLFKDNQAFEVSGDRGLEGKKAWIESAKKFGSVENFVKEYYRLVKQLIKSGLFDSVGHLDIIKMYNREKDLFRENSDWYKKEILSVLDCLSEADMAFEINLRGLIKSPVEQYPSLWILQEARKRNIPITIGGDSHQVGQVGENIDKAYELAREAGYNEIVRFKARKRITIPI